MDDNIDEKITESFLLNENPFIFSDENFGTKELKTKLEALQSLQPPFIPFAIDQAELKNSLRHYYENHEELVEKYLDEYFACRNIQNADRVSFLSNRESEEVIDLLIKIKQIKLYNKQAQLRERVHFGLKEVMTAEQLEHAYMCKIPDEGRDAAFVDMLEKKNRLEKQN